MTGSGLAKVGAGGVVGLAVGYLFDPSSGRARRAELRAQARARLRREARTVTQRAHYERGRVAGVRHRFTGGHRRPLLDDRMLVDRVRSETLGRMPELAHRINVDACNGVLTVRGQLSGSADIERVMDAVSRTPGVDRVVNLLHLSGEVAPNKADALRASG